MNTRVRWPVSLLEKIHRDLDRPHAFAMERAGFLICGPATLPGNEVLLAAKTWMPVDDAHYIDDHRAGATIGPEAFRRVLEFVYNQPASILHVHRHEHRGIPAFSRTDTRSMAQFVPGFFNACRTHPHGGLVLSHDAAVGAIWFNKASGPMPIHRFDQVGQPITTWRSA